MPEAAVLSGIILFANIVLRPISRRLERPAPVRADAETHYLFRVVTSSVGESHVRVGLVQYVGSLNLMLRSVHSEDVEPAGRVEIRAVLVSPTKQDQVIEQIVNHMSIEPTVTSVSWELMAQMPEAE